MSNRRDFLKSCGVLGLAGITARLAGSEGVSQLFGTETPFPGEGKKITLPELPYAYDALEPFVDKETMKIHHTKHHQAYIDKLNTVPANEFDPAADLVASCKKVDAKTSALLRNNLGGHYNHQLFWTLMKPNTSGSASKPTGKLAAAIEKSFKSFDDFNKEFTDKASKIFGSGWCWLIQDNKKNLKITTTPNQDNPLMQVANEQGKPILGLDVWEHAYYLKYQNKRAEYISNWWNVVNWENAERNFEL